MIILYTLLIITLLAIGYVYSWSNPDELTLPVWAAFSALWFYLYRIRQLDLMMLSALIMAAIVLTVATLAHAFSGIFPPNDGLYFLLALLVTGLSSAGAIWLRKLSQHAALASNSRNTP